MKAATIRGGAVARPDQVRRPLPGMRSSSPVIARHITLFCVAVLYAAILMLNYRAYISPAFAYLSFVHFDHDLLVSMLDLVLAAFPTLFLSLSIRRPSDLAIDLIYIIVLIPSILLTSAGSQFITIDTYVLKLGLLASFGVLLLTAGLGNRLSLPPGGIRPRIFMMGLLGLAVVFVGVVGMTFGFRIVLHAATDIYEQRDSFKAGLSEAGYNMYVVGMLAQVICPIMLSYGLVWKKPAFIVFGLIISLYVFSITGLKTALLSSLYVVAIYVLLRYFQKRFLLVALFGTLALNVVGILTSQMSGIELINDLLIRRTFIIQGLLTQVYFEYMQSAPFEYLSHSVLGFLFGGAIWANPDDVIGMVYFNGTVHANASLWSDGYLNAGYIGLLLSSAAVGLFLAAVNYCTSRCDLRMACCAFAMIFMLICQTGIIKVAGTHGGIFACAVMVLADLRRNQPKLGPASSRFASKRSVL